MASNMRSFSIILCILLLSLIPPVVENVEAQSTVAAVDLNCTSPYPSGAIDIAVHPGATLTGYSVCTVSNPSIYQEKISIQADASGLVVAAPGSITLAPGGESEFQVTVRAESRMTMQARTLSITATVIEMNGVPPPNMAESTSNQIVNILQFSALSVEMVESSVEIYTGDDYSLEYMVYNQGNWMDRFSYSTDYDENLDFKITAPIISAEIESMGPPHTFILDLKAPSDGSAWQVNEDGVKSLEITVSVTFKSEFSCRYEGACNSVTVLQSVTFLHNETTSSDSEILSSETQDQLLIYGGGGAGIILLLVAFFTIKKRRS